MLTIKKFVKDCVLMIFPFGFLIALLPSALIYIIGQLVFGVDLGGFWRIYLDVYAFVTSAVVMYDIVCCVVTVFPLRGYAKNNELSIQEVERAWWDYNFRKLKPSMLTWDKEMFVTAYTIATTKKSLGM